MVVSADTSRSRHDNDIPTRRKTGGIEPVDLSQTAADRIAHAGMAELRGYRVSYAVGLLSVFAAINDQIWGNGAFSLAVQTAKIAVFFQSTSDIQGRNLHC